ncbi:MAG TPA: carbonic anhydrase [Mycobacteriales bacterium]
MTTQTPTDPDSALRALLDGNARFVDGRPAHPNQDVGRRAELERGQAPFAVVFGCSDSRVAAEIIFDRGLGDLFMVRTAGHVVDSAVLGSIEFAVDELGVPLVVILGHDSCGAVTAAAAAVESGQMPTGYVRDIVERITPAVMATRAGGGGDIDAIGAENVRQTASLLLERSPLLAQLVEKGRCGIVGVVYDLADGRVRPVDERRPGGER